MAKTLVSLLLDETGSMQVVKGATISGFNEYIETLKNGDGAEDMRFTMTRFNSEKIETPYDAVDLPDVAELTEETYLPDRFNEVGHMELSFVDH